MVMYRICRPASFLVPKKSLQISLPTCKSASNRHAEQHEIQIRMVSTFIISVAGNFNLQFFPQRGGAFLTIYFFIASKRVITESPYGVSFQ